MEELATDTISHTSGEAGLGSLRSAIDAVDDELLRLLAQRAQLAQQVGQLKQGAIYRPEREAQILQRALRNNPGPLAATEVRTIFQSVIAACRALQQPAAAKHSAGAAGPCAANPGVGAITPYVPGQPIGELARQSGLAASQIIKLASNENPLGMSPKARLAVLAALDENGGVARYPDAYGLTYALARHLQIDAAQIVLGNGSNDVLDLVARVFLAPGCSSVFSQYAFAVYPLATLAAGAECIQATAKNYGHDLQALHAALRPDTRVVWIANPNNPTGTLLPAQQLHEFLEQLPAQVLLVLDEAYNEYLPAEQRAPSQQWLQRHPNLIITRTFSKIYGLAGLRVGYALATPPVAELMNRVRQPFNVNNLALAAATAALEDSQFLQRSVATNQSGMQQLRCGLEQLGLDYIPSSANFISFAVPEAASLLHKLQQRGVIVRSLAGYAMPAHLRVSIGTAQENARFLQALAQALTELKP